MTNVPVSERWWFRVLMGALLVGIILAACAGEASKEVELHEVVQ